MTTKWNPYNIKVDHSSNIVEFISSCDTPKEAIKSLSKTFKNFEFKVDYEGEQDDGIKGSYICKNGEIKVLYCSDENENSTN